MANKNLLKIAGMVAVLIGTSGCRSYMNNREFVLRADEYPGGSNYSHLKKRETHSYHSVGYLHRLKKDKE